MKFLAAGWLLYMGLVILGLIVLTLCSVRRDPKEFWFIFRIAVALIVVILATASSVWVLIT